MGEAGKRPSSLVPGREAGRENRRTGGQRQSRKDKREKRAETSHSSHPAMFARSPTETADRKSASSATGSVANNSGAVPSSLADRRMPTEGDGHGQEKRLNKCNSLSF